MSVEMTNTCSCIRTLPRSAASMAPVAVWTFPMGRRLGNGLGRCGQDAPNWRRWTALISGGWPWTSRNRASRPSRWACWSKNTPAPPVRARGVTAAVFNGGGRWSRRGLVLLAGGPQILLQLIEMQSRLFERPRLGAWLPSRLAGRRTHELGRPADDLLRRTAASPPRFGRAAPLSVSLFSRERTRKLRRGSACDA